MAEKPNDTQADDAPRFLRVDVLVGQFDPILVRDDPLVQSGVLARLVAMFIARHPEDERDIRLGIMLASVKALVPLEAAIMGPGGSKRRGGHG